MATAGRGGELGQGAVGEDAAVADLDEAVGTLRHAVVVGDHDAGLVARVNLVQEGVDNAAAELEVQAGGGLVDEEEGGVAH